MAERTLIDAMARDLWLEDARAWLTVARRLDGFWLPPDVDIDPAQYDEQANMPLSGPSFRAKWEGQSRAALRALYDHGPTKRMIEEFYLAVDAWSSDFLDDRDVFRAMLAAELEERQ